MFAECIHANNAKEKRELEWAGDPHGLQRKWLRCSLIAKELWEPPPAQMVARTQSFSFLSGTESHRVKGEVLKWGVSKFIHVLLKQIGLDAGS